MPTDLTTVRDHPAAVLDALAVEDGIDTLVGAGHTGNARALRAYEREHNVTFVALDNDALAAVREAYAEVVDLRKDENYLGAQGLAAAISDLLGLGD